MVLWSLSLVFRQIGARLPYGFMSCALLRFLEKTIGSFYSAKDASTRVICSCENGTRFNFTHTMRTTMRFDAFAKVANEQKETFFVHNFLLYTM